MEHDCVSTNDVLTTRLAADLSSAESLSLTFRCAPSVGVTVSINITLETRCFFLHHGATSTRGRKPFQCSNGRLSGACSNEAAMSAIVIVAERLDVDESQITLARGTLTLKSGGSFKRKTPA